MFILRFSFKKIKTNKKIRTIDDIIPAKSKQYYSGGFYIIHQMSFVIMLRYYYI